jgi:DHA2 family multidrug resistance protein
MASGAATQTTGGEHMHRGLITATLMIPALLQVVYSTIAIVALPHMQGAFSTDFESIQWVITSYIVALAVALPLMGWLAERFGRRNVLLAAVAAFTFFSFMVGVSTSLVEVVVMRILQGMAAAAFTPIAQATLFDVYPRERHGTAMAIFALGVLSGPILGPVIGGYITEYYSWRWAFFITVPLGLIAVLMVWNFVPRRGPRKARPFDAWGFLLLSIGVGALQYALDRGNSLNWFSSTQIVVAAGIAAMMLWMYPWYASLKKHAFVSLRLFRDRNFALGILLTFMIGLVLLVPGTLLPQLMQNHLGYPVLTAGLTMAPRGIGAMIAAVLVGRLIRRINPRYIIVTGLLINSAALFLFSGTTLQVTPSFFVWVGALQGIGLGLTVVPMSTVTFSTLSPQGRAEGTPVYSLVRYIGAAIGISTATTLLTRHVQSNHAQMAAQITSFNPNLAHYLGAVPLPAKTAMAMLNGEINRQASIIAYNDDFLLMAGLMLLMIPVALALRYRFGPSDSGEIDDSGEADMAEME